MSISARKATRAPPPQSCQLQAPPRGRGTSWSDRLLVATGHSARQITPCQTGKPHHHSARCAYAFTVTQCMFFVVASQHTAHSIFSPHHAISDSHSITGCACASTTNYSILQHLQHTGALLFVPTSLLTKACGCRRRRRSTRRSRSTP